MDKDYREKIREEARNEVVPRRMYIKKSDVEEHGYTVREKRLTRDEFYIADEAFFTGTAAEVTPIRELDGRIIGEGKRGPITEELQSVYFDLVRGKSDQHQDWLTYVS